MRDHPWFEGIDWVKMYDKGYPVMRNDYIEKPHGLKQDERLTKFMKDKKSADKISDWTFIDQTT